MVKGPWVQFPILKTKLKKKSKKSAQDEGEQYYSQPVFFFSYKAPHQMLLVYRPTAASCPAISGGCLMGRLSCLNAEVISLTVCTIISGTRDVV